MNADAIQNVLDGRRRRQKTRDKGLTELTSDLVATGGEESVSVCIRVRPFNRRESQLQAADDPLRSVIEMPDGVAGKLRALQRDPTTGEYSEVEVFQFTRTFWSISEEQQPHRYLPIVQEDIFECIGRPTVANALGGYNVCVFAYGQTGSGKTHTMMGDIQLNGGTMSGDPGLIPRLVKELYTSALTLTSQAGDAAEQSRVRLAITVKLSAIEIYNEQVRDLLWRESGVPTRTKSTALKIRKHPTEGHFVDELTWLQLPTWESCLQRISSALAERTVAATLMNDESSRSHSVFQVVVTQVETVAPPPDQPYEKPVVTTRVSRINLVDLAGSERLKKSGAQGQQLKEAAGINQSLSTLKKVIDVLVHNSTEKNPKRHQLVPYRESALTQLLSHSLGGNSKTIMFACVSPHYDNQEETLLTLRYANRAKGIVNTVKANEDNAARQEKLLKEQLAALQNKLLDGPQQLNEGQRSELRDQLLVGQQALEQMVAEQKEKEKEAERLAKVLQSQKDARYASSYYSSFKRVLLERTRDQAQGKLKGLETVLQRAVLEKEAIQNIATTRERSLREAEYTVSELKRREELHAHRTATGELAARILSRDILKMKAKTSENLMNRFGLQWMREHHLKGIRAELKANKETAKKEHEQYLQSIVREAKKQFEFLVNAYADKEASQQERLASMERAKEHAETQLEKSQHLRFTLQSSFDRAASEHARREKEREAAWMKRYTDMEHLFQDKLKELHHKREAQRQDFDALATDKRDRAVARHGSRLEELKAQLARTEHEGNRRYMGVKTDIDEQIVQLLQRADEDAKLTSEIVEKQFATDFEKLQEALRSQEATLDVRRRRLASLHRYATAIDATCEHATSAVRLVMVDPRNDPEDSVALWNAIHSFIARCGQAGMSLQQKLAESSAALRKSRFLEE